MGRIAEQLRRAFGMTQRNRIVSFTAMLESVRKADTIKEVGQLIKEGYDPVHAVYLNTMNLISLFAEEATALPPLHCAFDFLRKAEDIYIPGYPPMSPVTGSYYLSWTLFDVPFGRDHETIGDCFSALADLLQLDPTRVDAVRKLCQSRMGVYEILNGGGGQFRLRELITGREVAALIPSGFVGDAGSLLYVRLLPPLEIAGSVHVATTTPYVLLGSAAADWIEYFERQQIIPGTVGVEHRLHQHMKMGKARFYWIEFVHYGYFNYRADAIFMIGLPDRPQTQPHHPKFDPKTCPVW